LERCCRYVAHYKALPACRRTSADGSKEEAWPNYNGGPKSPFATAWLALRPKFGRLATTGSSCFARRDGCALVLSAALVAAGVGAPSVAKADEGGVSFWLPGLFGSLAAAPLQPGMSLTAIEFYDNVRAGGDVALAREVEIGQFKTTLRADINGQLSSRLDLGLLVPSYTFEQRFLGAQATASVMTIVGSIDTTLQGTISGTLGPFGFSRSGSRTDNVLETGDLYPMFNLRWNSGVNNFMTYITGDLPVGDYDRTSVSNLGIGHYALDGGAGRARASTSTRRSGRGCFRSRGASPAGCRDGEGPGRMLPAQAAGARALPARLPRERVVHPAPTSCPCCGGNTLRKIGEDVTETLEHVPSCWKVIQHVREKFSCRSCETIAQTPAPSHPIARGRAGPFLLAHILFCKYGLHLPLTRQSAAYAREGVELDVSTLADWVGAASATLMPLVEAIRAHVFAISASMPTIPPCRYWRRASAEPDGCGPMCATTARLPGPRRRPRRCSIPPTAAACMAQVLRPRAAQQGADRDRSRRTAVIDRLSRQYPRVAIRIERPKFPAALIHTMPASSALLTIALMNPRESPLPPYSQTCE
jgi:transposase